MWGERRRLNRPSRSDQPPSGLSFLGRRPRWWEVGKGAWGPEGATCSRHVFAQVRESPDVAKAPVSAPKIHPSSSALPGVFRDLNGMVSGRLVTKIAHLGKSLPTQAARFEEGTMKLMGGRRALPQAVFVAYRLIARSVTSGMGGCPTALLRLNLQKEQHVCDLPFQAPPKRRRTAGGSGALGIPGSHSQHHRTDPLPHYSFAQPKNRGVYFYPPCTYSTPSGSRCVCCAIDARCCCVFGFSCAN